MISWRKASARQPPAIGLRRSGMIVDEADRRQRKGTILNVIAVIGAGAMGSAIGARLKAYGASVVTPLDGRSAATIERAASAGMTGVGIDAVATAPIILSIVPPSEAVATASKVAKAMADKGGEGSYIDLNAIAPATVQEMASLFRDGSARFLDGCIIGGPPKGEGAGPHIYISGGGGDLSDVLNACGLDVRLLDGSVGAASALKMCYAGINKGLVGLGAAMTLAAIECGADRALMAEMQESVPELRNRFTRSIPDMFPKAYRWVAEMNEIAEFLGPQNPAAGIFRGMANLYARMADDRDGGGVRAGQLVEALRANGNDPTEG
jgi:3-hydroxyisobutyrate dehydrogenase-like beta-hydroxyacid dehydrogenase